MRIVPFKTILDGVLRRHGIDPESEEASHDTVRAIAEHIQNRTRTAWDYYDWPELMEVQERVFRPLWNAGLSYSTGEQVYYFTNKRYYTAKSAVATGVVPTNATYWTAETSVSDPYISLEQAGGMEIGQVFGIYGSNPRQAPRALCYSYQVSESGIDLAGSPATGTVWIKFKRRHPLFTTIPIVAGKSYPAGYVVYDPVSRDCYRAIIPNSDSIVDDTSHWALQPFPYLFASYVKAGAFADGLRESDGERDVELIKARMARANVADAEAESYLIAEIDRLSEQGYTKRYRAFGGARRSGLRFGWELSGLPA